MSPEGSISRLLQGLKTGDDAAALSLWERYCDRLVRLARLKLRNAKRRMADGEDVALSAFHSLCRGAREGRFPALADRDGLWGLLVFITAQKAADQVLSQSPGPATLNVWAEGYERLLDRLGDATLRQVAELRVQGYTLEEIAQQLGVALRTVHRKIHLIRKVWLAEARP